MAHRCAIAAQQAWRKATSSGSPVGGADGFAPQLRIGLHTGELQRDGDGLTGSALHVASRIAASAAGGEILATISTFAESGVTPASPPTEISLRGISEPVAVAAVAW